MKASQAPHEERTFASTALARDGAGHEAAARPGGRRHALLPVWLAGRARRHAPGRAGAAGCGPAHGPARSPRDRARRLLRAVARPARRSGQASPCAPAWNPLHHSLEPYVAPPATLCIHGLRVGLGRLRGLASDRAVNAALAGAGVGMALARWAPDLASAQTELHGSAAWSTCSLGSAQARLLCLLRAPSHCPQSVRAGRLQSRPLPRL